MRFSSIGSQITQWGFFIGTQFEGFKKHLGIINPHLWVHKKCIFDGNYIKRLLFHYCNKVFLTRICVTFGLKRHILKSSNWSCWIYNLSSTWFMLKLQRTSQRLMLLWSPHETRGSKLNFCHAVLRCTTRYQHSHTISLSATLCCSQDCTTHKIIHYANRPLIIRRSSLMQSQTSLKWRISADTSACYASQWR